MPLFDFTDYGTLLLWVLPSLIVALMLGMVGGLLSTLVIHRDSSFAVHGISELSFAGAAIALLIGMDVTFGSIVGSLVAAAIIGAISGKPRERNSLTAVLMPFGLGVGILALSLYHGRAASKFGLLTGQIVSLVDGRSTVLFILSGCVLIVLSVFWRRLLFASLDPAVAEARGVPVRMLSVLFTLTLGIAVAIGVQVVGALLVLSLLVTPGAAALRVTRSQFLAPALAVIFGVVAAVGGMMLSLGAALPVSPFITTISFTIYLVCWLIGRVKKGAIN